MSTEAHEFKAEIQQLLSILVHSLYTDRDIFLRELISNASDALSRIQFEILTNRDVLDPDVELAIRIDCDQDAKTLTIRDTGIGMTRDEIVENLGTIAHSGAAEFLKKLQSEKRPADVIGQFGVGFYSVYMVADEVTVTSRSYRPDAQAAQWTSKGDNTYTLADAEKTDRGTTIVVKLKEDAAEYAQDWQIEQIVKKHSDFVSFPIYVKDKVANRQTALWRQSPREVTAEQYDEFYKHLTLDFEPPLLHIHTITDVPVDLHAILFIPAKRERGIFSLRKDDGLKTVFEEDSDQRILQGLAAELLPLRAGCSRFGRPAAQRQPRSDSDQSRCGEIEIDADAQSGDRARRSRRQRSGEVRRFLAGVRPVH